MAVVGLERTLYQVSEDVGVVEVCAIVYRPDGNSPCPIDFAFDVSLSTNDNSAGELMYLITAHTFHTTVLCICIFNTVSPMDYTAVSLTILMFGACERRRCVNVTIENDVVLEDTESFDVTLERVTGLDGRISLDPVDGEIEITDNDGMFVSACQFTVICFMKQCRGCCWSGEDLLPDHGGSGCGGGVCYCVPTRQQHHMSHRIPL